MKSPRKLIILILTVSALAAYAQSQRENDSTQAADPAEHAKRNVITKIKQAVGGRTYICQLLSQSKVDNTYGLTKRELAAGLSWSFSGGNGCSWVFYDERAELWARNDNGSTQLILIGESLGSRLTDMRWSFVYTVFNEKKINPIWAQFDFQNGQLIAQLMAGHDGSRPLNDSQLDPNKRYPYWRYKPSF
jgi:hypothetical protein